jgi:hypothetical protein
MRFYLLLTVSLLAVTGCATTEFKPFEAKVNSYEGKGGTKTIVEGMELWDNGDPPRTYKVLGIIEDRRGSGLIPMASLQSDIVQKAKEVGGDAVIQLSSQSQITGMYTTGSASAYRYGNSSTAYGSSTSVPIGKTMSKFAVIKYLE